MIRRIVLCRHAKSDWEPGFSDFDRPLKKRGVEDIARIGAILKNAAFHSDLILSSPANRALSTAKGIAPWISYEHEVQTNKNIYEASPGTLFSTVQAIGDQYKQVMMFGHNPGMETLAGFLLGMKSPFVMPTCAMAAIEFNGRWQDITPGQTVLLWYLVPRAVRKKED